MRFKLRVGKRVSEYVKLVVLVGGGGNNCHSFDDFSVCCTNRKNI